MQENLYIVTLKSLDLEKPEEYTVGMITAKDKPQACVRVMDVVPVGIWHVDVFELQDWRPEMFSSDTQSHERDSEREPHGEV